MLGAVCHLLRQQLTTGWLKSFDVPFRAIRWWQWSESEGSSAKRDLVIPKLARPPGAMRDGPFKKVLDISVAPRPQFDRLGGVSKTALCPRKPDGNEGSSPASQQVPYPPNCRQAPESSVGPEIGDKFSRENKQPPAQCQKIELSSLFLGFVCGWFPFITSC